MRYSLVYSFCILPLTLCLDSNSPLDLLDRRIHDEIVEPTPDRGDMTLKEMIAYYNNLLDVFNSIKLDDEIQEGIAKFKEIKKQGGPLLLQVKVNKDYIKKMYKWDENAYDPLPYMLGYIGKLWNKTENILQQKCPHEMINL